MTISICEGFSGRQLQQIFILSLPSRIFSKKNNAQRKCVINPSGDIRQFTINISYAVMAVMDPTQNIDQICDPLTV